MARSKEAAERAFGLVRNALPESYRDNLFVTRVSNTTRESNQAYIVLTRTGSVGSASWDSPTFGFVVVIHSPNQDLNRELEDTLFDNLQYAVQDIQLGSEEYDEEQSVYQNSIIIAV